MTKLVFIANPNKPTSTMVTADEVESFMHKVPERTSSSSTRPTSSVALGPDFPARSPT